MENEIRVDPHVVAIYAAVTAMCDMIYNMPDCDMVYEMRCLIETQIEMMEHIFEGKHYGSDRIKSFIMYTNNLKYEMEKMRDAIEEREE